MWGRTDFPIRLDIRAGVGAMLAHWREDEHGWIGYSPSSREAYLEATVRDGALKMGLFMPLRLNALAQLLIGCWQSVVPLQYDHVQPDGTNLEYTYSIENLPLSLLLSPQGRPLSLRGGTQGWIVDIDQWSDETRGIPSRITLRQDDQSAVVRIQDLDLTVTPWQDDDLMLILPPGSLLRGKPY